MLPDFNVLYDRRDTDSAKWSKYPGDVLAMWVADMDFPVADEIIEAIRRRLEHPILGYAVPQEDLRYHIVKDMWAKYGWRIVPEAIVFLPGVEPGFNMALRASLHPGDGVVVQTPIYNPILAAPSHWQLLRLDSPLIPTPQRWLVDVDALDNSLRNAKAFLLCNPHNPTGKVFTRDELRVIADRCRENDTFVISDEIHCEVVFDGRNHVPFAAVSDDAAKRTVTLMAPGKTYNISGLKVAFAIIVDHATRRAFENARAGMVDSVNALGLRAALAAYSKAGQWKSSMLNYVQANRDFLAEEVSKRFPGIRLIKGEGTFLAWLDCTELKLAPDPQRFFLEQARVGLSAGAEFGTAYGSYVRLNFGCPRSVLADSLNRMERAVAQAKV